MAASRYSVYESSGVVKRFDNEEGYGYVADSAGGDDALLLFEVLFRDGYETISPGRRVDFKATRRGGKSRIYHLVKVHEPVFQAIPPETWIRAVVTSFGTKGFGFARIEGVPFDVHLGKDTLERASISFLKPGQSVEIRVVVDTDRRDAIAVRLPVLR